MPLSPPDRPLRRLIARLAGVNPQDRETILSDLPEDMQREVTQLLGEYRGIEIDAPDTSEGPEGQWDYHGFSLAIVSRLESAASFGMKIPSPPAGAGFSGDAGHDLTARALATLRECAGQVPARRARPPSTPVGNDPGLFQRLWGLKSL